MFIEGAIKIDVDVTRFSNVETRAFRVRRVVDLRRFDNVNVVDPLILLLLFVGFRVFLWIVVSAAARRSRRLVRRPAALRVGSRGANVLFPRRSSLAIEDRSLEDQEGLLEAEVPHHGQRQREYQIGKKGAHLQTDRSQISSQTLNNAI